MQAGPQHWRQLRCKLYACSLSRRTTHAAAASPLPGEAKLAETRGWTPAPGALSPRQKEPASLGPCGLAQDEFSAEAGGLAGRRLSTAGIVRVRARGGRAVGEREAAGVPSERSSKERAVVGVDASASSHQPLQASWRLRARQDPLLGRLS